MNTTANTATNASDHVRQLRERVERYREHGLEAKGHALMGLVERGRMRADALRYAQALRAAVLTMRSEVMRTTERSLAQLDELETWARTEQPPATVRAVNERFNAHAESCHVRDDHDDVPPIDDCSCDAGKQYRRDMTDMTLVEAPILPLLEHAWTAEDGSMPADLYGAHGFPPLAWLDSIECMFPEGSPVAERIQDAALAVLVGDGAATNAGRML